MSSPSSHAPHRSPVPIAELLNPPRERYGVDWSVKVYAGHVSTERFVIYGLQRDDVIRFLTAREVGFGVGILEGLFAQHGTAFRVMIGMDGDRTKLYGDLPGSAPGMVCVDLWPGGRHATRYYYRYGGADLATALDECTPELRRELSWLATQPPFDRGALFHIAAQRTGRDGRLTGADFGFGSDFEGLLRRDPRLWQKDLIGRMLDRCGRRHHLATVEQNLLRAPLGWVDYVGYRQLPGADFAINIYAKLNTVQLLPDGFCQMDVVDDGRFVPRPICIYLRLTGEPNVTWRLRPASADGPSLADLGHWKLDYRLSGGAKSEALRLRGGLEVGLRVADLVTSERTAHDVLRVLDAVRAEPEVSEAWVEPQARGNTAVEGIQRHY